MPDIVVIEIEPNDKAIFSPAILRKGISNNRW
jgi:hypothetical protein